MKKITLLLAGLMASGMASAVQLSASGDVTMADCAALNEDVRLNLTANVQAGVFCNAANNVVGLAACHTGGKRTQRTVPVKTIAATATVPEHLESCTVGAADPACAETEVTGPAMPAATTAMGTVSTQYPGGNTCTAAGAENQATVMAQ